MALHASIRIAVEVCIISFAFVREMEIIRQNETSRPSMVHPISRQPSSIE
jgi:hypothetical protein